MKFNKIPNNLVFTVGFLPKHSGTRKERLMVSSNETRTQIFYVPPHKLSQFLEETTPYFGESRFIYIFGCFKQVILTIC